MKHRLKINSYILLFCLITSLSTISCNKNESVVEEPKSNEYFYFEAIDAGSEIEMKKDTLVDSYDGPSIDVSLEYSIDNINWIQFKTDETLVKLENSGDRVYIRAKGKNNQFSNYQNGLLRNVFTANGKVKVGGNIMYLLDESGTKADFDTLTNKWVFGYLFYNMSSLIDASELVLPAMQLSYCCYSSMFEKCTSLLYSPQLPAMTLKDYCYSSMFRCCYSLLEAPELPATALSECCYSGMFEHCTSLMTAPKLPSTTLVNGCYESMFLGCEILSSIEVNFTEWTYYNSTYNWLKGTSKSGTFTCPASMDISQRDNNHIPALWTVVIK